MRYLALLRGINVGGKNLLKMPEVRSACEALGCRGVSTYIQSGNVIFESAAAASELSAAIEAALSVPVLLVSSEQLEAVVKHPPPGFGARRAIPL